ncbi:FLYWCH zinc finger domain-containing protein [Phthorimaea operculella]|nr:FLYWCH zinc finger domain-containing protein [Phthorimaea operculella]
MHVNFAFQSTAALDCMWLCQKSTFGCSPPHTPVESLQLVRNQSGKHLVLLFNYPFYNDSRNSWRCNKGSSCKARIVLDKNLQIVKANIDHNHAASNFVIKDGVYIRL